MDIPGFELSAHVLATSRGVVLRARRRSDGRSVLLKGRDADRGQRADADREHEIFRRLNVSFAPALLDTVHAQTGVWLVLEDRGLSVLPARPSLRVVLRCAIGLAEALQ